MPEPAPRSPSSKPDAPQPAAKSGPPGADPADEEGALFRALLDAGAEAAVAYTAERRIRTMVSEAVASHLQPFGLEMSRLFGIQGERIGALEQEMRRLFGIQGERIGALEQEMRRMFGVQGERIGALEQRVEAVEQRLEALEQRLEAVEQRLEAVEQRVDALTQRVEAVERRVAEQNGKLDVVLARLDGFRVLGQVVLGILALLVTSLITIVGILLTG